MRIRLLVLVAALCLAITSLASAATVLYDNVTLSTANGLVTATGAWNGIPEPGDPGPPHAKIDNGFQIVYTITRDDDTGIHTYL